MGSRDLGSFLAFPWVTPDNSLHLSLPSSRTDWIKTELHGVPSRTGVLSEPRKPSLSSPPFSGRGSSSFPGGFERHRQTRSLCSGGCEQGDALKKK